MVDALAAGTIVALVAGPIGWFMVLRRQTFAGHTLAVVGFPGAAGAALIGVSATYGYFAACIAAALVIAAVPRLAAGSPDRGVRRHRHHPGLRPGLRLPVRDALRRQRQRGGQPAVRQLPGHHRDPGGRSWPRWPPWPWPSSPSSAVRCSSPPSTPRPPRAGACRCGLCRWSSWCCWGWPRPRPARSPGRCWCSPCWCCPRPPPRCSPPARLGAWPWPWSWPWPVTWLGLAVSYFSTYPIGFWITSVGLRRLPAGPGLGARRTGLGPTSSRRRRYGCDPRPVAGVES